MIMTYGCLCTASHHSRLLWQHQNQLRQFVTGLLPCRQGFNPRPVHVGFLVGEEAMVSVFHNLVFPRQNLSLIHHWHYLILPSERFIKQSNFEAEIYEACPESKATSCVGRKGNFVCLLWQHCHRPWSFTCELCSKKSSARLPSEGK